MDLTGWPLGTRAPDSSLTPNCQRRARREDRIRIAKDTRLCNLPLKAFAQNKIWCAIVALASDLLAWMGMLALTGHKARRWEPNRLRLFMIPAALACTGRRTWLRLSNRAPWAVLAARAVSSLRVRAAPS